MARKQTTQSAPKGQPTPEAQTLLIEAAAAYKRHNDPKTAGRARTDCGQAQTNGHVAAGSRWGS